MVFGFRGFAKQRGVTFAIGLVLIWAAVFSIRGQKSKALVEILRRSISKHEFKRALDFLVSEAKERIHTLKPTDQTPNKSKKTKISPKTNPKK